MTPSPTASTSQMAWPWRPIESAPENVEVQIYCEDQQPAIMAATLVPRHESVGGWFWKPSEDLVNDVLDYELTPSAWHPITLPHQPGPIDDLIKAAGKTLTLPAIAKQLEYLARDIGSHSTEGRVITQLRDACRALGVQTQEASHGL